MGILDIFRKIKEEIEISKIDKRTREREEREFEKVGKIIKEKKADLLGRWLEKFSIEGDFWIKEKRERFKEDNWL